MSPLFCKEDEHVHSYTETVYIEVDGSWIELKRCPSRNTGFDIGPQTFPCGEIAMPWWDPLTIATVLPPGATVVNEEDLRIHGHSLDSFRTLLKKNDSASQ